MAIALAESITLPPDRQDHLDFVFAANVDPGVDQA